MDLAALGFGGWGVGSDPEAKKRLYGSGHLVKQGIAPCDDSRSSKVAKAGDLLLDPDKGGRDSSSGVFSGGNQQHTLCFLSPKPYVPSPNQLSHSSASLYGKHSGAIYNGTLLSGGPFTPSQYMELEHQALIYKYIVSDVPVPSNLLIPIKKAFESAVLACQSGGLFRANTLGWGAFHLGLSRGTDTEPGRCRRTDGKKWRCSKEAVADQKYCEKHMNRGRHRSRKLVEGQLGHSVSGAATTTISSGSALVGPRSGISNGTIINSTLQSINRMLVPEENFSGRLKDSTDPYLLSPTTELKSKENTFSMPSKQQFLETDSHRSVHQFMNDWPENPSSDLAITGVELDVQSDGTQLSIAIPTAFSLEKKKPSSSLQFGPQYELDKVEMIDLGVGIGGKQGSCWMPISWESSMGGPLAEALQRTNSSPTGAWVSTNPSSQSSPTGVLQGTTFASLSNSSAGNSPIRDNSKNLEAA